MSPSFNEPGVIFVLVLLILILAAPAFSETVKVAKLEALEPNVLTDVCTYLLTSAFI